ncbi:glycoside hydrolase family protein [Limnothrix sp. FACHB-1083]|uniref:glycoside hydrolase family protein n=1 Tax=unclassified Limnothrix TaxID=2632864 RepID=UPI00167FE6B3|nr:MULTISPECIES: glycoside hydrolase family protein [unclassified Limnothrix]MBD2162062.1 glycoside hydrolase family protein [Limnothrix sp. FACHB-1083]MBD2192954.1 glycoside hydrolase family protein [Limnothrix sp. FACHB-1088]
MLDHANSSPTELPPKLPAPSPAEGSTTFWGSLVNGAIAAGSAITLLWLGLNLSELSPSGANYLGPALKLSEGVAIPPLAMQGGDPYLRALMRTISVSEANGRDPYAMLYGGRRVRNLSQHPQECVTILLGPNMGNCSTAAGRYQMLDRTWFEKAKAYHPDRHSWGVLGRYSFEPVYQDWVVYRWLNDRAAWGIDLRQALRQGQLDRVLRRLSGTWTSLGYGIETNRMTRLLPSAYRQILREELKRTQGPAQRPAQSSPLPTP